MSTIKQPKVIRTIELPIEDKIQKKFIYTTTGVLERSKLNKTDGVVTSSKKIIIISGVPDSKIGEEWYLGITKETAKVDFAKLISCSKTRETLAKEFVEKVSKLNKKFNG